MKALFTFLLFVAFSQTGIAQCPTAGQDTAASYCKNEFFDVADLRSPDADLNGAFISPWGDTMTTTVISLQFPGQYNYFYQLSDTACPTDTAKYVITIINFCWFGISENALENETLIQNNPVTDKLTLRDEAYDQLEIYEPAGRCVLTLPASSNTTVDVSKLESGNYILIVDKNGTKQFQRFIK